MTLRDVFRAADGRLRVPWRIGAFLGIALLIFVATAMLLAIPLDGLNRVIGVGTTAGDAVTATIAMIGAHIVMIRFVDRGSYTYAWLDRGAARGRTLAAGLAVGAAPIAIASGALLAIGWLEVAAGEPGSWLAGAARVSVLLAVAALFEELFSRGYLLAALADGIGMPAAVALTSVGFGLLHIPNPGVGVQPIVMVILAGLFLAAVLLATRSLYAAWAAHFAWNWVMAVPFHVAVSGVALPLPRYAVVDAGPDWATGGPWGPEGGAFAGLLLLALTAWLFMKARNAQRPTQNA